MTHWNRLALPVCLGVIAGLMNWYLVRPKFQPVEVVVVARNMEAGEVINEADLRIVAVPAGSALPESVVTADQRPDILMMTLTRGLHKDDLLLRRDIGAFRTPKQKIDEIKSLAENLSSSELESLQRSLSELQRADDRSNATAARW